MFVLQYISTNIRQRRLSVIGIAVFSSFIFGLLSSPAAHANLTIFSKEVDIRFDAGFLYDDNVTRANMPVDKLGDHSYSVNIGAVMNLPITDNSRALLTGALGGEKFDQYSGLSHSIASAQGELQYRRSAEFSAPTLATFLRTYAEQYESGLRSGSRYSVGFSISKPITDRIRIFGAVAHNQRYGKSAVFNMMDDAARINLDYSLTPRSTIYLGAELRRGDIVSTGQSSLENIDIADVFAQDIAFPGGLLYSYRFKGSTVLSTLGFNFGMNSRNSLDFSWRMIESTPDSRPSYATSPSSYIVNQYSVVYLFSF